MESNELISLLSRYTKSEEEMNLLKEHYNFISADGVMSSDLSAEPNKPYIVYGSQKRVIMSEKKIQKHLKSKGLGHLEEWFIFIPEESFGLEINKLISKLMGISMQERINVTGFTFEGYTPSSDDNNRLDLSNKKVQTLNESANYNKDEPPEMIVQGESTSTHQSNTSKDSSSESINMQGEYLNSNTEQEKESIDTVNNVNRNDYICGYNVPIIRLERLDKNVIGLKESLKQNVPEEELALFTKKFKGKVLGKLGITNS